MQPRHWRGDAPGRGLRPSVRGDEPPDLAAKKALACAVLENFDSRVLKVDRTVVGAAERARKCPAEILKRAVRERYANHRRAVNSIEQFNIVSVAFAASRAFVYFEKREQMLERVEQWSAPHTFEVQLDGGKLVVPEVRLIA